PSHTITPTYTATPSHTITPTYTATPSHTITPTYTATPSHTITRSLTQIEVGFNEYNNEYVQMSILIPDDKTLTGFAFDYSNGEYYNISIAVHNVTPDVFIFEPSTIDNNIKRCAFVSQSGVSDKIDIIFKYTTIPRQDKNTQAYTGAKIQGLRVEDFIAYDDNKHEIQYEVQDMLMENSALY
ncbi:MAG: hypothetical protein CL842_05475, partial [Crocinitomicaceae bacterium]|nr:hypothetical protein [Crocinitomicaceae bacterium]